MDLLDENSARSVTDHGRPSGSIINGFPSCSPDGRMLAFSSLAPGEGSTAFRVGLMALDEGNSRFQQIGDGFPLAGDVSWSADGRSVVFMHYDRALDNFQIYRLSLNRPLEFENLTADYPGNAKYPDWSTAAGQVAFACHEGSDGVIGNRIWHLCLTPDTRSEVYRPLTNLHQGGERDDDRQAVFHAITPSWSADGQAIAYASDLDGDWDIYVYHLDTGRSENLTAEWPSDEMHPNWRR